MSQKTEHFRQLPESIQNLISFAVQRGTVTKVVLFGSRARGTARDNSDYDFALWVDDRQNWSDTLALIEEKNLTLLPVDLLLYEELNPDYRQNIETDGLLIYG